MLHCNLSINSICLLNAALALAALRWSAARRQLGGGLAGGEGQGEIVTAPTGCTNYVLAVIAYGFFALGIGIKVWNASTGGAVTDMALPAASGVLAEAVVFYLPAWALTLPIGRQVLGTGHPRRDAATLGYWARCARSGLGQFPQISFARTAALVFGPFFPTSDAMVSTLAVLSLYALGYAVVRNRTHPEAMK
jgi:hypothetical protein